MEEDIEQLMAYPLTNKDILAYLDGQANIEVYPNLVDYETIDDLLDPYGCCFLLFELKPGEGHWTLLQRLPNGHIEFFNSYGGKENQGGFPDDCLEYVPKKYKKESNQDFPYLTKLLYESPAKIDYNQYKFQRLDDNVKTCGRWCLLRHVLNDFKLKDFAKIFNKKYGDELVSYLIQ